MSQGRYPGLVQRDASFPLLRWQAGAIRPKVALRNGPKRLTASDSAIEVGQVFTGPPIADPVRVESVHTNGPQSWVADRVGAHWARFGVAPEPEAPPHRAIAPLWCGDRRAR